MNTPFKTRSREEARLLLDVHRYEATKVAGPGSSRKDIRDVLWTLDEVIDSLGLDEKGASSLTSLVDYMRASNEVMTVPDFRDGDAGHVSRMAETIRLLGHTYEYWHRGRPGADAVRWLPVAKDIPDRNITNEELVGRLDSDLSVFYSGPHGEDLRTAVHEVVEGINPGAIHQKPDCSPGRHGCGHRVDALDLNAYASWCHQVRPQQ